MDKDAAAEVVRRWVIVEQGRSEQIAEKVVATLKRDHLLSLPGRLYYSDCSPESNAYLRRLWRRAVKDMLQWVEKRPGSNEGRFSQEVLDVIETVVYPDEVEAGSLQDGGTARTQVPQQLDEHRGVLDREPPFCTGMTRPREDFSKLFETRQAGFLSSATLQRSPGGHGLAFPSWIIPPMSFVIPFGSPDYRIEDVEVQQGFVDNGDWRARVVQDGLGCQWQVLETEVPNLQGFLEEMQAKAYFVIYRQIDRLRYKDAMETLQSMKQKLWASFEGTPLALWIEVHLAQVLLRVALVDKENAHTLFEEALSSFNRCLTPMRFVFSREYMHRLYCSACLGRAWYYLINGDLEEAREDIQRVEKFVWKEHTNSVGAKIQIHWAFAAICLSAGDLKNAVAHFEKIGYKVESTRSAVNESQRMPLDIHLLRSKGELSAALAVCARCILSEESPTEFDPVTKEASEQLQQLCMGVIGDIWFALGACNEAYKYYTLAGDLERNGGKSGDLILRAAALVGRANVNMRLCKDKKEQHLEHAQKEYEESMSIYEGLGHAEGRIIVHCNLGMSFMVRGQDASSVDQVQAQGLFDQALRHYRQARELALHIKLRPAVVELDCKMGQVYLEKKELTKAISLLEKSQELGQARPEPLAQAWIEHQLGHCLLKRSENEKGSVKSVTLCRAEVHLINAIKHFASVQLVPGGTEPHYERLWFTMFEEQKETYALLQWCLACQNRPSDAVVWGERGRSRALLRDKWEDVMHKVGHSLQINGDHGAVWLQNLHPKHFDELPCEAAWDSLQRWTSLSELNAGIAIVQYTICRGFGVLLYVLDGSSEPSLCCMSFVELGVRIGIRNVEDIEQLVIGTVDAIVRCDPKKPKRDAKETERKLLIKLSDLLLLPIEEELNKKSRSQHIRQLIIIPHEHLNRVPFPALYCKEQTAILGLRKRPRQHLIEKYALSCVDSIRSLILCSVLYKSSLYKNELHLDQHTTKRFALIVGIIDLDLNLDLDLLHEAEDEAQKIADICKTRQAKDGIQLVLGPKATKNFVMQSLAEAQLVHLATHASITPKYEEGGILFVKPPGLAPKFSGESMQTSLYHAPLEEPAGSSSSEAWRGRCFHEQTMSSHELQKQLADEVFLDANEISGMKLTARLVVLSACQTGRGVIAGEGVAGLGRALTRAGVPCDVLSLWNVHDGAAKKLMVAFYTSLVREPAMSVAIALQKAMVKMIMEKAEGNSEANLWEVRHWAAFQAFGFPSVCL